jgi:hypothetical protein
VPRKCGHCKHWHRVPSPDLLLGESRGECRALPPQVYSTLQQGPEGLLQIVLTEYPKPAGHFDACGLFEARTPADAE